MIGEAVAVEGGQGEGMMEGHVQVEEEVVEHGVVLASTYQS